MSSSQVINNRVVGFLYPQAGYPLYGVPLGMFTFPDYTSASILNSSFVNNMIVATGAYRGIVAIDTTDYTLSGNTGGNNSLAKNFCNSPCSGEVFLGNVHECQSFDGANQCQLLPTPSPTPAPTVAPTTTMSPTLTPIIMPPPNGTTCWSDPFDILVTETLGKAFRFIWE